MSELLLCVCVCRERVYRVARGLEEIWGRLRNSSRSIVPELSCKNDYVSTMFPLKTRLPCSTLSSFMKRFLILSTSSRSTTTTHHSQLPLYNRITDTRPLGCLRCGEGWHTVRSLHNVFQHCAAGVTHIGSWRCCAG